MLSANSGILCVGGIKKPLNSLERLSFGYGVEPELTAQVSYLIASPKNSRVCAVFYSILPCCVGRHSYLAFRQT